MRGTATTILPDNRHGCGTRTITLRLEPEPEIAMTNVGRRQFEKAKERTRSDAGRARKTVAKEKAQEKADSKGKRKPA